MLRIEKGPYEVRNIKTFRGREGEGTNCTLFRDGKKIALVDDPADGSTGWHKYFVGIPAERKAEEKALIAHAKKVVRNKNGKAYLGKLHSTLADSDNEIDNTFLMSLVDDTLNDRAMRRKCKTKTLFRIVKIDGPSEYRIHDEPFTLTMKEIIMKWAMDKHCSKVEFINEEV